MKKGKIKALLVLLVIVLAGIYYYATIPAINIHSTGIWIFILFVLVLILAAYAAKKRFTSIREVKSSKFLKIGGIVMMAVLLVFAAVPCFKLFMYGLLLKVSGALIGVVADKRLTGCVIRTGDAIWLMLRLCLAGAGGFVILVAVVTCLTGKGAV